MVKLETLDIVLSLVITFVVLILASGRKKRMLEEKPYYKYYVRGLLAKLGGAYLFCLIYLIYYGGGDTTNYFAGVQANFNVFWRSPVDFIAILFGDNDGFTWSQYDMDTGYPPPYMFRDDRTFLVIKITSVLSFLGFGKFVSTTIVLASVSYRWIWKGYIVVAERYPQIQNRLAIGMLMVPSVIFWGSGIMKDTYTLAATFFLLYAFIQIIVVRKKVLVNLVQAIFALYLIISIKSYILFALLPGILILVNFERLSRIKSYFSKIVILPITVGGIFFISQWLFVDFSEMFGRYSADRLLEEAVIQQQDLKRDAYGTNSFDIGEFDATLSGALSKFPQAVNAALFRPYLWESGSPTMLISGLENTLIIGASVYFLILLGPFRLLKYIFKDPFLIFCLLFTLILGFGVGLSTSNFGALVRYKIPFVPFFVSMLFVLDGYRKKQIE